MVSVENNAHPLPLSAVALHLSTVVALVSLMLLNAQTIHAMGSCAPMVIVCSNSKTARLLKGVLSQHLSNAGQMNAYLILPIALMPHSVKIDAEMDLAFLMSASAKSFTPVQSDAQTITKGVLKMYKNAIFVQKDNHSNVQVDVLKTPGNAGP